MFILKSPAMIEPRQIKITWKKITGSFKIMKYRECFKMSIAGPNIWFALYLKGRGHDFGQKFVFRF